MDRKYKITYAVDNNRLVELQTEYETADTVALLKERCMDRWAESFINRCERNIDVVTIEENERDLFIEYEYTDKARWGYIRYVIITIEEV